MGQFVSQSKTLKGVLWAVESQVPLFDTFTKIIWVDGWVNGLGQITNN